jgi:hypothetical protein
MSWGSSGAAAGLTLLVFLSSAVVAAAQPRALSAGGFFVGDGEVSAPVADPRADGAPAATLNLPLAPPELETLALGGLGRRRPDSGADRESAAFPLTAERAQILLRSLTVPGWGQATLGRNTSAGVFGLAELGVWATFTAFRIQVQMRRESYELTARLLGGIDLRGRDEEFRRVVGSFLSNNEYNRLVVYRDAANLYLSDPGSPDYAGYRAYIAAHEVHGRDAWSWDSEQSLLRYRAQRRNTTQASQRANTALAVAIVNRLASALHAARVARHPATGDRSPRSWNLEVSPSDPSDATAFRLGIHTRF